MNEQFHALLIGIDAYPVKPLRGCVNDIDAVQRLLLHRLQVAPDQIWRLASPHPGAEHDASVPEQAATLANIRAAFAELASERVSPGDRVLIYFAGHGAYAEVIGSDGRTARRESLVPVDVFEPSGPNLVFAHELNDVLRRITSRTRSVAVVLDCSQTEGATRYSERAGRISRSLGVSAPAGLLLDPAPTASAESGLVAVGIDCQVVAACLSHEMALEDDAGGVPHGVFTRSLVEALSRVSDAELATIAWNRIWPAVRSEMSRHSPWQTPWIGGSRGRAVFAGPPVDGDAGYSIRRVGGGYEIDASTLDGVTPGSLVAVYGPEPRWFPPIDSQADRIARVGLVEVTTAERSGARARVSGPPFDVPLGARARLVRAGRWARLRCAVSPLDAAALASIGGSPLLEVVEPALAQVRLDRVGDRWILNDDVHAIGTGFELFALETGDLGHAREVLEHYFHYALPQHLAALSHSQPGALGLAVLSCGRDLPAREALEADLLEAPSPAPATYELRSGDRVCFRVTNHSASAQRVTLLASAASGKVQLLGDQIVEPGADYVFWAGSALGRPFVMSPPRGMRRCIDRLVAIGTTSVDVDLGHLRVDKPFAAVLDRTRGHSRDVAEAFAEDEPRWLPTEPWTVAQAIVRTYAD